MGKVHTITDTSNTCTSPAVPTLKSSYSQVTRLGIRAHDPSTVCKSDFSTEEKLRKILMRSLIFQRVFLFGKV